MVAPASMILARLALAVALLFLIRPLTASAGTLVYGTFLPYQVVIYSSSSTSLTLANTQNIIEEINTSPAAAMTITLNSTSLINGFTQCVKDGTVNFYLFNATIKTSDGSTIDGGSGSTGYTMNQTHQFLCFTYDAGTSPNWIVSG